jgi:drug/metabolite transporter (DMT)-like permease
MKHPSRAQLVSGFAAVYVLWGSTYLAIRFAVETIPPFLMAGTRHLVAGAILYAFARRRGAPRPTARHWKAATGIGALLLLGGNGLVSWAEQRVASGPAALIVASVPIWMVLLSAAQERRRPSIAVLAGLALALAGIALLVFPNGAGRAVELLPAGALLVAALSWSARSALSLAYLIVAGSILGFSAYVWLLTVSTPERVSTYAFVNPIVAVAFGVMLAGEKLTSRIALASAVIVAAVALILRFGSASRAARPARGASRTALGPDCPPAETG